MTHDTKASVNTSAQRGCAAFSCHAASAENNTALLLDAGLLPGVHSFAHYSAGTGQLCRTSEQRVSHRPLNGVHEKQAAPSIRRGRFLI